MEVSFAKIKAFNTGRVLLGLRSKFCTDPFTWNYFGGTVKENESPRKALERELSEEILNLGRHAYHKRRIYDFEDRAIHIFTIVVLKEFDPELNWEHIGSVWVVDNILSAPRNLHPTIMKIKNMK